MSKVAFLLGLLIAIGGCTTTTKHAPATAKAETAAHQGERQAVVKSRQSLRRDANKASELIPWRGFNALQTSRVAWGTPASRNSLIRMGAVGANAVVLIPFMRQNGPGSAVVHSANNVTDSQLIAAVKTAQRLGLKVVMKPQILVRGSWAGEIGFGNSSDLQQWFESYSSHILRYARLAEELGVEAFVIGTELAKVAPKAPWPRLISKLRRVFGGLLTYAAHNVEGVERFPYWDKLDVIGISTYPALGDMGEYDEMLAHVELNLYKLSQAVKSYRGKGVWLLEIGMPSAQGASSQPWAWRALDKQRQRPDLTMQTAAMAAWMNAIRRLKYVEGVFVWCWYSDPNEGGERNIDYSVQNKPAEIVIRQYWRN